MGAPFFQLNVVFLGPNSSGCDVPPKLFFLTHFTECTHNLQKVGASASNCDCEVYTLFAD